MNKINKLFIASWYKYMKNRNTHTQYISQSIWTPQPGPPFTNMV